MDIERKSAERGSSDGEFLRSNGWFIAGICSFSAEYGRGCCLPLYIPLSGKQKYLCDAQAAKPMGIAAPVSGYAGDGGSEQWVDCVCTGFAVFWSLYAVYAKGLFTAGAMESVMAIGGRND